MSTEPEMKPSASSRMTCLSQASQQHTTRTFKCHQKNVYHGLLATQNAISEPQDAPHGASQEVLEACPGRLKVIWYVFQLKQQTEEQLHHHCTLGYRNIEQP